MTQPRESSRGPVTGAVLAPPRGTDWWFAALLILARPAGVVPITVTGVLSRISIERPIGVAAGLEIRGGVSQVTIDGQSHKSARPMSIQTPGADASPDRYEIEITGSASKVTITARYREPAPGR